MGSKEVGEMAGHRWILKLPTSDDKLDLAPGHGSHPVVYNTLVSAGLRQLGLVNPQPARGSLGYHLHVVQAQILLLFPLASQDKGARPKSVLRASLKLSPVASLSRLQPTFYPAVDLGYSSQVKLLPGMPKALIQSQALKSKLTRLHIAVRTHLRDRGKINYTASSRPT